MGASGETSTSNRSKNAASPAPLGPPGDRAKCSGLESAPRGEILSDGEVWERGVLLVDEVQPGSLGFGRGVRPGLAPLSGETQPACLRGHHAGQHLDERGLA